MNRAEYIKDKLNIVNIIKEYVPSLEKDGVNWKALCPFHKEKTPSLIVNEEKKIFNCFGCNTGGDIFTFIQKINNINFNEALRVLEIKAGLKPDNQLYYDLLNRVSLFYKNCLNSKYGIKAKDYLINKRGVKQETIDEFDLGYSPKGLFLNKLKNKSTQEKSDLESIGVIKYQENREAEYYEYMEECLVFPIKNECGQIMGFGGKHPIKGYINTTTTDFFKKGNILYNLNSAKNNITKLKSLIIVEGYFDSIILSQAGFKNIVSLMSTNLSDSQIQIIKKYCDNVVMILDNDNAGLLGMIDHPEILMNNNILPYTVILPNGNDPDEFLLQYGRNYFIDYVTNHRKINLKLENKIKNLTELKEETASSLVNSAKKLEMDIKNNLKTGLPVKEDILNEYKEVMLKLKA